MGKICTQQLPDHVIALMVPNEQNLAGIEQEVRDIRERHEICDVDLVLSRVPRLDDLEGELRDFESKVCRSTRLPKVLRVHAAESLALLKDDIYCADDYFARAQLTEDYQRIVKAILIRNFESREAVLYALEGGMARVASTIRRKHVAAWVDAVQARHANDEIVLEELKAALRGAEHAQQRLAVSARLEFITQLSRAAIAARSALEADREGDRARACKEAIDALSHRVDLALGLTADCFALLCRISPDDADRIARDRRSPTIASMLLLEKIAEHEKNLLSTLGGVEAVHEAISARMRFQKAPEGEVDSRTKGGRAPHRICIDQRIDGPLQITSAALGVATFGFGLWLLDYARLGGEIAPPRLEVFGTPVDPEDPDKVMLSFWWRWGMTSEESEEDRRLRRKGEISIMNALCGTLRPAKELLAEIDDLVSQSSQAASEPILNGWRMLYTSLGEFKADLQDLVRARESEGCAVGSPPPRDLRRLAPPLGKRRGQESK